MRQTSRGFPDEFLRVADTSIVKLAVPHSQKLIFIMREKNDDIIIMYRTVNVTQNLTSHRTDCV